MEDKQPLVTVVGFNGAFASAITGAMDIFSLAGVSWERFNNKTPLPRFKIQLASFGCQSFVCTNKIVLSPDVDLRSVMHTDILLVPTIGGDIDRVLNREAKIIPHLKRLANTGCDVVSNCSGAFFLAEAGLLNGKQATTHWGLLIGTNMEPIHLHLMAPLN